MTAAGAYGVRLEDVNFEGPLDLLLFLIKKNEIDIYDIPIALVTEQFLGYLERITADGLEGAGDFLLMAATLLRIKSQMLLPAPEALDDEELEDPRRELVTRILEYQQYREVADTLRGREERARKLHARGERTPEELGAPEAAPPEAPPEERRVSLKDLLRAFAAALAARPEEPVHRIEVARVTIEERMRVIRDALASRGRVLFSELFAPEGERIELVVTLVALLEMVRNRELRLRQSESFGEIEVIAAAGPAPSVPGPASEEVEEEHAWTRP